jgi:hypothetical protein
LRQVEVLSVKNCVGEPIPEFCQHPEEGTKIPSGVRRQDSGDVFPNDPTGLIAFSNCTVCEHERAARIVESAAEAGDAERLTGRSSHKNVDCCIWPVLKLGHVIEIGHVRKALREKFARGFVDF